MSCSGAQPGELLTFLMAKILGCPAQGHSLKVKSSQSLRTFNLLCGENGRMSYSGAEIES